MRFIWTLVALLLLGVCGTSYAIGFVPEPTVDVKKQSRDYTPWKQTQADTKCKKQGGTDSAPVCGGTCTVGICDLMIDAAGKSTCGCS